VIYRYDAIGMHFAALVDRDIFAGFKTLVREVKSDFVGSIGAGVVMERPAATLAMNETTVIVLLARPQSRDPAGLSMIAPEHRIDPVVDIERCDDDIGDGAVAFGVTRLARKPDPYLPKLCRKRCIQDGFGMGVLHVGLLLIDGLADNAAGYFCSAAVVAAVVGPGVDFFRLLMMIVISGTISRGSTPFKGWWIIPDSCDCSARASSCNASIEEP